MNAEALIGTVLGTCTLQKLVGQGGMGAVYLAQQSRPKRQVAVKVLLPMTPLSPNQLAAFLERFRRETDAVAALVHPNVMPVHEYGEQDGLAYLVMPYISGGTLRDEMEREGPLSLEKVVNYLDQLAAAVDAAHEHGIVHRDIKPANILLTPEGRLLLTDFGLVKILATDGQAPQVRLTGAGAPVGTPDYMAPEQVIGEEVDTRADLYSLGVILYQMVTGTTPFQGETPMQIAAQHLQIPPPSPQMLRPDLPVTAEQVMLRALAKRPSDRYTHAQDLANAFRNSLTGLGIPLSTQSGKLGAVTSSRLFAPKVAGKELPTGRIPAINAGGTGHMRTAGAMPVVAAGGPPPPAQAAAPRGGGLLSRTGKFPQVGTGYLNTPPTATRNLPLASGAQAAGGMAPGDLSPALNANTGMLAPMGQQTAANTVKLTGPVKVLKVPVAGQPGRYVTGILPVVPQTQELDEAPQRNTMPRWLKIFSVVMAIVLVSLGSLGIAWFVRNQAGPAGQQQMQPGGMMKPDAKATSVARATATVDSNTILFDPLKSNVHNWQTDPPDVFFFKDGAYHISVRDANSHAAVLPNTFTQPHLVYTLTMQELQGKDDVDVNTFGMVFRFNQQNKGNRVVSTFYSFEVSNMKGGNYQFWKYDDTDQKKPAWNMIWSDHFGPEFHAGHGPDSINTFKVTMDGNKFTFNVNGKNVNTSQDDTFKTGTIGMLVNLNGTEVAFRNLSLTLN